MKKEKAKLKYGKKKVNRTLISCWESIWCFLPVSLVTGLADAWMKRKFRSLRRPNIVGHPRDYHFPTLCFLSVANSTCTKQSFTWHRVFLVERFFLSFFFIFCLRFYISTWHTFLKDFYYYWLTFVISQGEKKHK